MSWYKEKEIKIVYKKIQKYKIATRTKKFEKTINNKQQYI